MNEPQFKIHVKARRKVKHEISKIKSLLKGYWYYHQLDKDMASFYGSTDTFPMSDEKAQEIYDQKKKEIEELKASLQVPYASK